MCPTLDIVPADISNEFGSSMFSEVNLMLVLLTPQWLGMCRLGPSEFRQQPGLEHARPAVRGNGPAAAPRNPASSAPWLRPPDA